jgi:peroxiredoxin (alkyl hydroperoxide reductase subunit C)
MLNNDIPAQPPTQAALRMGDVAPDFQARTTKGPVQLSQYRGRWLLFFSHPADFTPVCTSEFIALAKAEPLFAARDCALLGLSVDSLYSHIAWTKAIEQQFGVAIPFPVIEDPSMAIARAYGMIAPNAQDSATVRASYIIDPHGVVQLISHYPMSVGRSVPELLRSLIALQATMDGQHNAPADWQEGDALLLPASHDATGDDWFCRKAP